VILTGAEARDSLKAFVHWQLKPRYGLNKASRMARAHQSLRPAILCIVRVNMCY